MGDPVGIAFVGDHPGELLGDTEPPLRLGEQHDPTVGSDPPAIERPVTFLRSTAGNENGKRRAGSCH
jgi:hypothetical protein